MATQRPDQRVKRSLILDVDQDRWLERKALAEHVSVSHVLRRYLRAAMRAELDNAADTEEG